jgi:hypothetical protein
MKHHTDTTLALIAAWAVSASAQATPHPEGPYDQLPTQGCRRCHSCEKPTPDTPCLLTCIRTAVTPSRVEDGPDIVILDQLVDIYLPVPFDHKGHARMAEMTHGCATCHHFTPPGTPHPACRTCHDPKSAGTDMAKPGLKGAYHRQCLNCHKEWTDEKDCIKCHAPKTGASPDALAAAVTKDDLLGRMHPPIPEPDTEIYRADARASAGQLVIFRHREHIHRFGLACAECHHEDNCRRCHSQGNGHQQRKRTITEHHKPCVVCHTADTDESRENQDHCKRCHWSPGEPRPRNFDHADTGWPLGRYHAERSCRDCHKAVPFTKLDRNCASCHQEWSSDNFDHTVTGQKLDETHAALDCTDCHAERNFTARPVCADCHDADEISFPGKRPGPQPTN